MSAYSDAVLALSPVAYWRLGEPSGTIADNAEGTAALDGTYTNSPTLGVAGLLTRDPNTAVAFTIAGQNYVTVPDHASLKPSGAISICGWFQSSSTATYNQYVRKGDAGAGGYILRTEMTTGYAGAYLIDSVGQKQTFGTVNLCDGNRHFLAMTGNGTTLRLYVDGLEIGSGTACGAPVYDTAALTLGGWPNASPQWVTATQDEWAVFGTALSGVQIAALYALGLSPPYPPLPPGSAVEYVVELFSPGATFGPSTKIAEVWDLRNLGWSRYDRLPGRGFFTLYQTSPHLASIVPITTHCRITRVASAGDVEVFNGIVSDYNSTGDDVVFDIYDYVSLLSLSRSGYRTLYPTKLIGSEIVSPEWLLAKNATNSALGFVATGTIENPLGTDDATAIKTNAQFGLMDQMRLALFYDLTEMGRANTNHHVTFEITRTAAFTFNFWKNKGSLVGTPLVLGGTVSDYTYAPNWAQYRNNLATLGTTVGGGAAEVVVTNATSISTFGLRQDVFAIKTLAGIAGSAVETDQQKAVAERMLKAATEGAPSLWVTLVPGTIAPFAGWDICDTFPVEIVNGADSITGNWRVIGARAIMDEPGERLQLLVAKVLT